jgi:hypothetical protein
MKKANTHFQVNWVLLIVLLLLALKINAQSIASFSPSSGPIGTVVTITGTGFSATPSENSVFFGATGAAVSAATVTELTVTVPIGASYHYIYVTNLTTNLTAYSSKPFNVTYNCGSAVFAAKVDISVGTSPYLVAISDLDGDGKPDLATANASTNNVSALRNTGSSGTISFAASVNFATGATALGVAAGDLDGDGKQDLAVTNQGAATVSVLRNTSIIGTISFAAKVDFAVGTTTSYPFIGDLDGDGKPDLAVANQGAGTVSVLRNTSSGAGNISFAPKVDYTVGASPNFDFIGDLDSDGKPDLAVSNVSSASISTFRNTSVPGTISFAAKVDFATGTIPYGLSMCDLDGDSKLDLVTANWLGNNISTLRNTSVSGTISFAAKVDFGVTLTPHGIAAGDLDGDGRPDLVVTNTAPSNKISVLINTSTTGTISFAPKVDYAVTNNPYGVVTGDLDGDGKLDIASSNTSSNSVSVLRNIGSASSISFISFTPESGPIGTTVTIAGTGFSTTLSDNIVLMGATEAIVSAATATSLTVTVPLGTNYQYITVTNLSTNATAYSQKPFVPTLGCNPATFSPKVDVSGGAMSVEIYDVDGDGKPDLVLPDYFNNVVCVSRNTGTSGTISFAPKVDFASNVQPNDVALGDLDGDGKLDMAVVHTGASSVSTYKNTSIPGSISFEPKVDFAAGTQPDGVKIIDFDGDGKPDIVSANWGSSNISVLRNTTTAGTISFAAAVNFATGVFPNKLDVGDLDGDSKPDIAVTNWNSSSVSVFRNTCSCGTISFAAKVDFATGPIPEYVHIGDLDGDGKRDLALASRNINTVSTYRNLSTPGTISFAAKVDFATGVYPYGVAIGDLNGDGKLDLAVANYTPFSVSTFQNNSTTGTISFGAKVDYTTGAGVAYDVGINDFDGDGWPDLAVSKSNNTVAVFKNTCTLILPIELIAFNAKQSGTEVLLTWNTASEFNNDYFTVEHSTDGTTFEEIGQVKGAGNSNMLLNYSFPDVHPHQGLNYYRIKQTDFNGRGSYSEIEVVEFSEEQMVMRISPNPSTGLFWIELKMPVSAGMNLSITNAIGKTIYTVEHGFSPKSMQFEMNLSNQPEGMYILQLKLPQGIYTKQLIIAR